MKITSMKMTARELLTPPLRGKTSVRVLYSAGMCAMALLAITLLKKIMTPEVSSVNFLLTAGLFFVTIAITSAAIQKKVSTPDKNWGWWFMYDSKGAQELPPGMYNLKFLRECLFVPYGLTFIVEYVDNTDTYREDAFRVVWENRREAPDADSITVFIKHYDELMRRIQFAMYNTHDVILVNEYLGTLQDKNTARGFYLEKRTFDFTQLQSMFQSVS